MRLFFAGAENSEWRKFLAEEGVEDVSMSFVKLTDRVKLARPWTIESHFPGQHVLLDAGGYSYNKKDAEVTEEDAMAMAVRYMAFVTENINDVDLVTEFDANILGHDWLIAMREDFYDDLGDRFVPIWRTAAGREDLDSLASKYPRVGVLKAGLDESLVPVLNSVVSQYGVALHGLGIADWEMIQAVKWDSVSSGSWLKPSQFGETIIWTGHELKRYPANYKDQARKRHRSYIEQQGFDAAKIIADDRHEILRLSVWSWQQFMASIDRDRVLRPFGVTRQPGTPDGTDAEPASDGVDTPGTSTGNDRLPATRDLKMLPIVGITTITGTGEDGEETEEHLMQASSKSLLRCDNCEIRDMCPEFRPGHECAYEFPAYVSTKNQMRALQDFLIKLQTQRVLRMSMMEQLKGGYADQNLSAEADRLQRMIKAKQEAERQGFSLHIEASSSGEAGAISRIFGRDVGDASSALPQVQSTTEFMSDIVEAELVADE
jgi:hypothetical protein